VLLLSAFYAALGLAALTITTGSVASGYRNPPVLLAP
jgi:hypothetical protein